MVENEQIDEINSITRAPEQIQLLYANTVGVALTLTDIHVTLSVNGRPAVIVALPLATAKTLSQLLKKAVDEYQTKTGQSTMDLAEITSMLKSK